MQCQKLGGKLVKIESEDENEFIRTEYLSTSGRYWIGLSDHVNEGHWKWTDGTKLTGYENWGSGQPNNHLYNQDCVAIRKGILVGVNYEGEWNDEKCTLILGYICEKGTFY